MGNRKLALSVVLAAVAGACGGGSGGGVAAIPSPISLSAPTYVALPSDHGAGRFATGFFDGDPWPDLAVASIFASGVDVLRGRGDGQFDALAPIQAGMPFGSIEFVHRAFLDLDPFVDLVVTEGDFGSVQTYLGRGDGTFDPVFGIPLDLGFDDVRDVQVGRLNGDVVDDVVVVVSDRVLIFLGNGFGGLSPAPGGPVLVGTSPVRAQIARIDTGFPPTEADLVVCDITNGFVHLLAGDGAGGFAPFPTSPLAVAGGPAIAVLPRLDGASALDLVVVTSMSPVAHVFLGDGLGGFAPVAGSPFDLRGDQLADMRVFPRPTPDSHEDVMVITFTAGATIFGHQTKLITDGAGGITRRVESRTGVLLGAIGVEDVNQDGHADLLQQMAFEAAPVDVLLELRFGLP